MRLRGWLGPPSPTVFSADLLLPERRERNAASGWLGLPATDLPGIVWQADSHTLAFRTVSGASERLLGVPPSYWVETPGFFTERIHAEDRAATMALYQAAISQDEEASAEFRGVSASGLVWLRETIRVTGSTITGIVIPVDRRRQFERQLVLAERNRALHEIASRLAYDLHNPLTIVGGFGEELLNALPPDDPMRDEVEQILDAGKRISALAGKLLGYAQRQASPPGVVNVPRTLAYLKDRIQQAAGDGVAVEIRNRGPALAFADEKQFEEVVLALVPREGSRVIIECDVDNIAEQIPGATLSPGRYVRLSLRGNAPKHEVAFESFLDAQDGAARARAYTIVREWSGDIALVDSAIVVYLPYCPPFEANPF